MSGKIDSLQFYVIGSEENQKLSHVQVSVSALFRQDVPVQYGVYDPHMGTTYHTWACQTCFNAKALCPGHSGHIMLNYPVQSPMFMTSIIQWLKIICFKCGNLVGSHGSFTASKSARLGTYVKKSRGAERNLLCSHCAEIHPHITRDKQRSVTIWAEFYNGKRLERKYQLFNHKISEIFQRITPELIVKMGKSMNAHPSNMILTVISVPPNSIRPDIKRVGGGRSSNDDITTLTKTIVDINNVLPAVIPEVIDEKLELHYTNQDMTYLEMIKGTPNTSGKNKVTTTGNKPPSSISGRIPKKSGRMRQHLHGSRCWWAARSVITCDPMMRVDQLGIPMQIATEIQLPEVVSDRNIKRLTMYFNNKHDVYPGCTRVVKQRTGVEHWVGSLSKNFVLEVGDTVMRDLIDGDVCIFNRQPSMLSPCMSCHKVQIIKGCNTIKMNVSACVFYQADFDGDCMLLLFASSIITRNEIETLANVGNSFISRKSGGPLVGCYQDSLASLVELTRGDVVVDRYSAMEMFKGTPHTFTKDTYTGHDLVSMLLPPINYTTTANFYNEMYAPYLKYKTENVHVVVERGIVKQGILDHRSCGQEMPDSIFHAIHNEYGPTRALDLLFRMQQVTMEFMYNEGFTININDITINPQTLDDIHRKTSALIHEADRITDRLRMRDIIAPIGLTIKDFYEDQQINALVLDDEFVEPIMRSVDTDNNGLYKLIQMCKKGSMKHFQAITSAVGSSMIRGNRAARQFGFERTLPYFTRFDTHPISNGFNPGSYVTGVRPDSHMFSCQEARYSVINKQLFTAVGGVLSREGGKNTESLIVNNYRQLAKQYQIIQFMYGDNGADTRRFESVMIPTIMLTTAEFKLYRMEDSKHQAVLDAEFAQLSEDRDTYRCNYIALESSTTVYSFTPFIQSIVNVKRIVTDVIYAYVDGDKAELDIVKAVDMVKTFCQNLPYIYLNNMQEKAKYPLPPCVKMALGNLLVLCRSYLNTSFMIKHKITIPMLSIIMDKIKLTARKALIDYGTAVGILATQVLTEPLTQSIISSHHRSGVSGGVASAQTDKITRSHEIFWARQTDKMRNPKMRIYVLPEYESDELKVTEIANHIESLNLRRFVDVAQIFFEEYKKSVHPEYKHENALVDTFEKHMPNIAIPNDLSCWVIRMELNKLSMVLKNMDLETIVFVLIETFPGLFIVHGSENDTTVVIRAYVRNSSFKKSHAIMQKDIELTVHKLLDTSIRGVDGIRTAIVSKGKTTYIDDAGLIKSKPIFMIQTDGTNFTGILNNAAIDIKRCSSDSIREVESIFGIESARRMIRTELEQLVPGLPQAHYSLYADEMCLTGMVTGISKPGLDRRDPANVLLRASYSFSTQVLTNAAVNSRFTKIHGMSAPLILGRAPMAGSTYNSVGIDHSYTQANGISNDDIMGEL